MTLGFAHLRASEEERVRAGGALHDQLVDRHAGTTRLHNACACGLSEAKSGHFHFGQVEDAGVISDGADNDNGAVSALGEARDDLAK